jgi:hypothetical protein
MTNAPRRGWFDKNIRLCTELFLFGKIHERKNEKKLAIENYEKLLDIWKSADKDLPDYVDAKKRLAKSKGIPAK